MSWVVIMDFILAFIEKCQENRANSEIVASLQDPGPREIAAIRRAIRRSGVKKKNRRSMLERALADLAAASMDEIEDLVATAGK